MGEAGAVAGGAAHEQVAAAGGGERHLLRAQERVRVARRASGLSALAHGVLLFYQVDRGGHLAARQWLFNGASPRAGKKNAQPTAAILDSQSGKNTATSTRCVGYDAGKRIKGRKRFFLVDTLGNLLACCVVAAHCHDGATAARLWDALALDNELLDRLQTVFVDGASAAASASTWRAGAYRRRCRGAWWPTRAAFLSMPSAGWWNAVLPGRAPTAVWPKTTNEKPSMPTPGSTWPTSDDLPS